jgi:hypothetical protein
MNPQSQTRSDYDFAVARNSYGNQSYAAGVITKTQEAIQLRDFQDSNAVVGCWPSIGASW